MNTVYSCLYQPPTKKAPTVRKLIVFAVLISLVIIATTGLIQMANNMAASADQDRVVQVEGN